MVGKIRGYAVIPGLKTVIERSCEMNIMVGLLELKYVIF